MLLFTFKCKKKSSWIEYHYKTNLFTSVKDLSVLDDFTDFCMSAYFYFLHYWLMSVAFIRNIFGW